MKNDKSSFGKNLIRFRKEKGLSQEKLAKLCGLSQRMIAYYEKQALNPPIDKIEIIAKALNIEIGDLIETQATTKIQDELLQLDSRTLRKIKLILSLSKEDRHTVYVLAEALAKKKVS